MSLKNTGHNYGSVAKFFHWSIAVLIILMILIGAFREDLGSKTLASWLIQLHKSTGLLILALMVLRLAWRWVNPTPQLPYAIPKWQRWTAKASHFLLYILVFCMIFSGWTMTTAANKLPTFYWLFNVPMPGILVSKPLAKLANQLHYYFAWATCTLIAIHWLAALKHHYIHKDNVLRRMLP